MLLRLSPVRCVLPGRAAGPADPTGRGAPARAAAAAPGTETRACRAPARARPRCPPPRLRGARRRQSARNQDPPPFPSRHAHAHTRWPARDVRALFSSLMRMYEIVCVPLRHASPHSSAAPHKRESPWKAPGATSPWRRAQRPPACLLKGRTLVQQAGELRRRAALALQRQARQLLELTQACHLQPRQRVPRALQLGQRRPHLLRPHGGSTAGRVSSRTAVARDPGAREL